MPIADSVVSVSSAFASTSRPSISYQQNATLHPARPNSRAMVRPSPVAPPVTIATRAVEPCFPETGFGSVNVAGAADAAAPAIHGSGRPPCAKGIDSEATGRIGGEQAGATLRDSRESVLAWSEHLCDT